MRVLIIGSKTKDILTRQLKQTHFSHHNIVQLVSQNVYYLSIPEYTGSRGDRFQETIDIK